MSTPLIGTGKLTRSSLTGQVAVVTGAGGGIGYETARALCWLGARVVIAEINKPVGKAAAARICAEFGHACAEFVHTDVGDERSVENLAHKVLKAFGRVDIVFNNATLAPMGAIKDAPISSWDTSYLVNVRGPVLLARAFLPGMLQQKAGVFVCVSSVGDKFMGAYETMKAAQVHVARTLDAELEETGVIAFTIGPGLVLTDTAKTQIARLAPMYGKTVDEFYAMSKEHIITVEEAGAGFAAAVALAAQFRGLEIDSRIALNAAEINYGEEAQNRPVLTAPDAEEALKLVRSVRSTLAGQVAGWADRPIFERQWVIRDFKKYVGVAAEQCLDALAQMEAGLQSGTPSTLQGAEYPRKLAAYFIHYQELAKGFVKDKAVLAQQMQTLTGWQCEAERLAELVEPR